MDNDPKLGTLAVLKNARALLAERGWKRLSGEDDPHDGGDTGPLTLTQALWRAARWTNAEGKLCVNVAAVGPACRALCITLGGTQESSIVELAEWARREGRTQEQVLRAFDRTVLRAMNALMKMIAVSADEEEKATQDAHH